MKKSRCNKLIDRQKNYLAGFIDGDGCIQNRKLSNGGGKRSWHLSIVQNQERPLDFIKKWVGYGSIYKPKDDKRRYCVYSLGHTATLLDFLIQVKPQLVWKKQQATEAIKALEKVKGYSKR